MIDTLIFDFDGVIIDTETPDFTTWYETFQGFGVELDRSWWTQFIGGSSRRMDICSLLHELTKQPVNCEALTRERRRRYVEVVESNPLLPGVLQYVQQAKELGLRLGIASSSRHDWVDGHLERRGLRDYFDLIRCADDVARVKPDPELYLTAAEKLGTTPANAVVIEDSANGVTAAKSAGAFCVVVPNPMTRDLAIDHADLRLDALSDMTLPTLLARAKRG